MAIDKIFDIGKRAMSTTQKALAVTSHNVANVNTKGYSRQRVELASESYDGKQGAQIGRGVHIATISRAHNQFIDKRIEQETSVMGSLEGAVDIYKQIELIFQNDAERGIGEAVNRFFNDVRTLSTQPNSQPLRTAVRDSAEGITRRFNEVSDQFDNLIVDVNNRVNGSIEDINRLTQNIASLNKQIVDAELGGGGVRVANDQRDKRDLALKELSKYVPIKTFPLENGAITVSVDGVGELVVAGDAYQLKSIRTGDGPNPGSQQVFVLNSFGQPARNVTENIQSGKLGALLRVRDKDIPQVRGKVDALAFGLANEVNKIHAQAYGQDGVQGRNFFVTLGGVDGASRRLGLSDEVKQDLESIGSASRPFAPGDNSVLLKIADLQDVKMFDNGRANFTDYMSSVIGGVGVEMRRLNDSMDNQRDSLMQLDAYREELSGVSLDEEALNMVRFQKAFDANAKMIQVADAMLDTVLTLKRF